MEKDYLLSQDSEIVSSQVHTLKFQVQFLVLPPIQLVNQTAVFQFLGVKEIENSFTKEDIEYIRTHYKPRNKYFGCRALARKFNVYHTTVLRVINGTRYVNNK